MKKSALLILLPLLLILVTGFVIAKSTVREVFGTNIFSDFFSIINVAEMGIYEFIIAIIIFIMLFAAFGDIISNFTMFSKNVAWIIGGGLAIITALTGGVVKLAHVMFTLVGTLGVISIVIALGTAFIAFTLIHIASDKLGGWIWAAKRQQLLMAAKNKGGDIRAAIKLLEEVRKEVK